MFQTQMNSIRRLAPFVGMGLLFAFSASPAHAQRFFHPPHIHNPVFFNQGLPPSTVQFLNSTRNNIVLSRTAAGNVPLSPVGISRVTRGLPAGTVQFVQSARNNAVLANAAVRLGNSQTPNFALANASRNFANLNANINNPFRNFFPTYNPFNSPFYGQSYGSPYGYGAGYGYGLNYANSGYGGGSYGGGSYGGGGAASAPAPAPAAAPVPAPRVVAAVSAFGVPTNDDGSIAWPFAFRLMSPDAKLDLLDPLAGKLDQVANQASAGKVNAAMVRESQLGVDRLYQWLRTHRLDLAEGAVRDANVFLGRIDAALRAMRADA